MTRKILLAGETGNHCLEMSYYEAFLSLGHEVRLFDTRKAIRRYARAGSLGFQVHRFLPVDAWIKKANKDLVNTAREFKPDLILVFTGAEILPGTFAYLRTVLHSTICWYWADPLPNLSRYICGSLPVTDIVFSYSETSLPVFLQLGARKTSWLPFAGDLTAHHREPSGRVVYDWDISFIGSWRPEREKVLQLIHQHWPDFRIRVAGPYWHRCTYKPIKKIASARPVSGSEFADIVSRSFLNLNVMDDSNYPSVNMRFFEILAAGGAELCSASPEMQRVFTDRKHLLFFADERELADQIKFAVANREEIDRMRKEGQAFLKEAHLYRHRAASILQQL
jgi:spore maturation protein CgeB